ncbi:hypothetical protein DAMA08_030980 [Martiniozyma asiatica (nom. inval.)]|nr:hypothetical protein DAMA08_030980 [Martiniozyma asiatica]
MYSMRNCIRTYTTAKGSKFGSYSAKYTMPEKLVNHININSQISASGPTKTKLKTQPPKKKPLSFTKQILLGLLGTSAIIYTFDSTVGYGIINRNGRALSTLLMISYDYKVHFNEDYDIDALHERNAQRLYDLIITNKGLYIKMGQMIAVQGMMFPKHYQDKFKQLFDRAPVESWQTCDRTLQSELGADYRERIFNELDEQPIASASVAQVHKGTLKNGDKVAVKIQKKSVSSQLDSDLLTFRAVMHIYSWVFDLPLKDTMNYICEKMREELDFGWEYKNAVMVSNLIKSDPEFGKDQKYYIPHYYEEISGKKILISEWIDAELIGQYKGLADKGYNLTLLMSQIGRIYARQVFTWGVVHCDLHPGNLMVRHVTVPNKSFLTGWFFPTKTVQQLVILDHGLYEHFSPKFKREYAEFWKYSMEKNYEKTFSVLKGWGMEVDEMIMVLAGIGDKNSEYVRNHIQKMKTATYFERQQMLRDRLRQFLSNTDKFPLCLVFVMRSMRIVAGLNKNFGSPINRLSILVEEAERSVDVFLKESGTVDTFHDWFTRTYVAYSAIIFSNLLFSLHKAWEYIGKRIFTEKIEEVEEMYDRQVMEGGELFGFEKMPSSSELIV